MYLRTTQRRRKDGSVVRYLQLAHNRRVGGETRAEVLLNLGREDALDVGGLRRLAGSITRYTDPDEQAGSFEQGEGLEVTGSRPLGGAWALDSLWVVIGLAVTREGVPVRVWVWPGNTSDQSVVEQVKGRPARLAAG